MEPEKSKPIIEMSYNRRFETDVNELLNGEYIVFLYDNQFWIRKTGFINCIIAHLFYCPVYFLQDESKVVSSNKKELKKVAKLLGDKFKYLLT